MYKRQVQTPDPTQANGLLTITPTPAVANVENGLFGGQTTTPTQEEQVTQPVEQDPSAKGGKSNPYLLDEVFTFDTEVLSSGWPRTNTADTSYDTVRPVSYTHLPARFEGKNIWGIPACAPQAILHVFFIQM